MLSLNLNNRLRFLVGDLPDANGLVISRSHPLEVRVESQIVNNGVGLVGQNWLVQVLQFPDLNLSSLGTGSEVDTVGVDSQSVDRVFVSSDRSLDLEELVPDLKSVVPSYGSVVLILSTWGVSDSAYGVLVLRNVGLSLELSLGVPKGQFLVESAREELSGIVRECARGQFFSLSEEFLDAFSGLKGPESHGFVPRRGKYEVSVFGKGKVGDEVVVSGEGDVRFSLESEGVFLSSFGHVDSPDHEFLVSGSRYYYFGFFLSVSGDSGYD